MANHETLQAGCGGPPTSSWIEKTPGVSGGEACVRRTRIPVWGLVAWRGLGLTDARILEHHPDLSPADLEAAWKYYAQNKQEVDEAIRRNDRDRRTE